MNIKIEINTDGETFAGFDFEAEVQYVLQQARLSLIGKLNSINTLPVIASDGTQCGMITITR